MLSEIATLFFLVAAAKAQGVGNSTAEVHPQITTKQCTKAGCTASTKSITVDANWRWIHDSAGMKNCYTGNLWDTTLCADPAKCAANCVLEGADYGKTYGITTSGDAITMNFVTGANIGSRVYLLKDEKTYEQIPIANSEFTFDVDVSKLPCGLNGAVYFSAMDPDGGLSKYPSNKAGAGYGTGYCDAQCPQDVKFINGEANVLGWKPSTTDKNSGTGQMGSCCMEMDVWEANSNAAAFTPHTCSVTQQTRCENDKDCGITDRYSALCDKDGCDYNSFRMGNQSFYGAGSNFTIDTNKKFTIVTQFIGSPLTEMRRKYIQNNVTIENSVVNVPGMDPVNSITDGFCAAAKKTFGDPNKFADLGGMSQMSKAMTLVLSIWDDHIAGMYWLDSTYPPTKDVATPGVARGTCPTTGGEPAKVEAASAGVGVTYSNIRWGDLDTTLL